MFPGVNPTPVRRAAALRLLVAVLLAPGLAGCVSSKYKLAAKPAADDAPPPTLELQASGPAAQATLHAVIVFHGPGSWKKDAYWDEYVLTVTNPGTAPLTLDHAMLTDRPGLGTLPGASPWPIEQASRERLKVAKRTGRQIALGAGATAAWVGSVALIATNMTLWGGVTNATAVGVGTVGFIGIPLVALGSGVRTLVARHTIRQEFDRRQLALPLLLAPGTTRTGSLFFPVTPTPARLLLRCKDEAGLTHDLVFDLTPLSGLHLDPSTPQRKGDNPTTTPTIAP